MSGTTFYFASTTDSVSAFSGVHSASRNLLPIRHPLLPAAFFIPYPKDLWYITYEFSDLTLLLKIKTVYHTVKHFRGSPSVIQAA